MNAISNRPRRALVTGGSGFIGHHLVRRLLEEGVETKVLLAPGDPAPNLAGIDVATVEADICDAGAFTRAAAGADTVFHLAAIYALWLPRRERMYEVNVGGAINAVRAAAAAGARLVHTSSIAAVGLREGAPADETTTFNRWTEANDYVLSKYVAELELLREARALGVPTSVVNPSFPLGPGDIGPTPTGATVKMVIEGKFPAWFQGGTSPVDVRDVAEGHWQAALRGRDQERYLLSGHNLSLKELVDRIASLAGVRAPRLEAPRAAVIALGAAAELIANAITRKAPPFTAQSMAYVAGRNLHYDCAKAERELGYARRPLEDTLRDAIAWFRGRV